MSLSDVMENDLDAFFNTDDFASTATLDDGTEISVIFHNEYEQVDFSTGAVESSAPYVEAKDSDISEIAHLNKLTIAGIDYKVIAIKPNGTGVTVLELSKD